MLPHLVDTLLQLAASLGPDPEADVRAHTAAASQRLAALAVEEQERRAAMQAQEAEPEAMEGQEAVATVEGLAAGKEAAAPMQVPTAEPVACAQ